MIDKDKRVAYIIISHGMFTWQLGNMLKALEKDPEKYAMSDPTNFKEFQKESSKLIDRQQQLVDDCGHMDWTEDCKYMCMNAFAVKWDADAKTFADYRTLEI